MQTKSNQKSEREPRDWLGEVLTDGSHATIQQADGRRIGNAFFDELFSPEDLRPGVSFVTADGKSVNMPGIGLAGSGEDMPTQDQYIDARLAGIESKLDIRMDAMQRFQDRAEQRSAEAEARMQKTVDEVKADGKMTRATVVTTAITSVIAMAGLVAAIVFSFQSTVTEQGAWLRQSVERIEQRVSPPPVIDESVTP